MGRKKEKGNWVSRLKKGVKYYMSGKAGEDTAKQELKEDKLKSVRAKLKKAKKEKGTKRTKKTASQLKKAGMSQKEIDKMRGNY